MCTHTARNGRPPARSPLQPHIPLPSKARPVAKVSVLLLGKLLIGPGQIWLYFAQFLDTFRHESVPYACRWIRIRMYTGLHLKRQSVFVLVGHDNFGGKDFAWIAGLDHTLELVHYGPVDRQRPVLSKSQLVTTVRNPAWRIRRAEDCCKPTQRTNQCIWRHRAHGLSHL